MTKILINGEEKNQVSVYDRAFQYGDGLFETIALRDGKLIYWDEHLQRLNHGCHVLGLEPVAEVSWLNDIKKVIGQQDNAVVKLIYSRGEGQRGYQLPEMQKPLRVVMVAPLADYSDNKYKNGINLKLCKTQASINPSLAGLKHLNKLENVIARNEWQDRSYAEGLMLDCDGYVIEGTMSNVFAVKNNSLYTPVLKRAGVNGVVRQRIIELAKNNDIIVQQINIKLDNFYAMDEIFVTNSLLGLCPVKQVEDRRFKPGSVTRQLMTLLQQDIRGCEL